MNAKERLLSFLTYLNIGQSKFERQVGISRGYINNNKGNLGAEIIKKISDAYPELNTEWLVKGNGNMLKSEDAPSVSYTNGVPYYDVDFIGGFDIVINDQTTKPDYMIDFKPYEKATCWCNITGHSMEPEINHGDIIALREIKDISFLPFGEIYAIITTNGMRTVKRLAKSDNPECYMLIPTNKSPEYGEQELPKKYIERVYHVLGCIKKL